MACGGLQPPRPTIPNYSNSDLGRPHKGISLSHYGDVRSDRYDIAFRSWAAQEPSVAKGVRKVDLARSDWIRAFVTERGAGANIPPKRNRKNPIFRNLVERFFNKIKQCRRIATRYDKLAANYLAFVKLACICLWLRVYECTA
jgi:Transposase DDE domain